VDPDGKRVERGSEGELVIRGPNVTQGYWNLAEQTARAFVDLEGERWYRTGDLVAGEPDGNLRFLGRRDRMVKKRGYRVELGEIEAVLREAAGVEIAIAVGWPRSQSGADGVVGFIGADELDTNAVLRRAAKRLPAYMRPRELRLVSEFPLNANGKVDRKALLAQLEREQTAASGGTVL